jgi:hypothetical protein
MAEELTHVFGFPTLHAFKFGAGVRNPTDDQLDVRNSFRPRWNTVITPVHTRLTVRLRQVHSPITVVRRLRARKFRLLNYCARTR